MKQLRIFSLLLLLALSLTLLDSASVAANSSSPKQETTVNSEVESRVETSTESVKVAEPFSITVKVYHSADWQIQFATLPDSIGPFAILNVRDQLDLPISKSQTDGQVNWQRESIRTVQLESWQAGKQTFPGLDFSLVKTNTANDVASGQKQNSGLQLTSEPVSVTVLSERTAEEPVEQLRGLAGIQNPDAMAASSNWLWWVGGGTFAVAALATVLWISRRRETTQPISEWALQRLQNLKSATGNERLADASFILRDYLNLRFGLETNAGTLSETVTRLQSQGWSPVFVERLERWLTTVEQVSFAGVMMDSDDVDRSIVQAMNLVDQAESMRPVLDQNDQPPFDTSRHRENE